MKIEKTKAAIPRWLLWFLMEVMPGIGRYNQFQSASK